MDTHCRASQIAWIIKTLRQIQYTVRHVATLFIKLEISAVTAKSLDREAIVSLPPQNARQVMHNHTFLLQWQHDHLHAVAADHILVNIAVC